MGIILAIDKESEQKKSNNKLAIPVTTTAASAETKTHQRIDQLLHFCEIIIYDVMIN